MSDEIISSIIQGGATLLGAVLVIWAAKIQKAGNVEAAQIQAQAMQKQIDDGHRSAANNFREELSIYVTLAINDAAMFISHMRQRRDFVEKALRISPHLPEGQEFYRKYYENTFCRTWVIERQDYRYVYAIKGVIGDTLARGAIYRDKINELLQQVYEAAISAHTPVMGSRKRLDELITSIQEIYDLNIAETAQALERLKKYYAENLA